MGAPLICVDNLVSVAQYAVTLDPSEEFEGVGTGQAFRVGDGRRTTAWTVETANLEQTLAWTDGRVRASDFLALDRGTDAPRVIYEVSEDNFATPAQVVLDITRPTSPGAGSLDDALGVHTEEGAWVIRHPVVLGTYRRLRIPAMGADLKPYVTGVTPGLAWAPGYARRPFAPDRATLMVEETTLSTGWIGRGHARPRREGVFRVQLTSEFQYEQARRHLDQMGRGTPFWLIHNDAQAERAVMAVLTVGAQGLAKERDYLYEQGDLSWVEWQPATRGPVNG